MWKFPENREEFMTDEHIKRIGTFKNKHGEEFLAYRIGDEPHVFVTGDEMLWSDSYQYIPGVEHLVKVFITNGEEYKEIEKLLEKENDGRRESASDSGEPKQ